ncbi:MAG: hypothetical protein GX864_00240 [Mollicutes bacterium]|nr:hypothetical protein [Mollicutes bacterium]
MKSEVYEKVKEFKKKYPMTLTWWRLKKHCRVIDDHLNPDEKVTYACAGQKNDRALDIFQTCVVVVTNKRLLIGSKRVTWGYFLNSITPDLFNDLKVAMGIIWGKIEIDTVKEVVNLSNLDRKSLDEIETKITTFMIREKKKYGHGNKKS